MTNVAVLGISGRVGRCLVRAIRESPDFVLTGALASPSSSALGRDAGEIAQAGPIAVAVTADREQALAKAEVAIDFTLPEALGDNLAAVAKAGIPLVVGITGLDAARQSELRRFSERFPVLVAPNMSLAVNLLFGLAGRAAAALPPDYDVEIVEAHHRGKADAPSGTALRLGEIVAGVRGGTLAEHAVYGRLGKSASRAPGAIGFASLRGGDIVGQHQVLFAGIGETLELVHRTSDRMTFAHGALAAARWILGRPPGVYGMSDVLGI
ncbi:MAG TPA: 4-hydroxy-tetrahydrodipicolinate reductase [Steroidobacteraceae bacterium]|jgi:4-hydroxy-tetrahydrodipicolinate reductase|nr:4-hydroxy-tetrahydrodipicolinate reductase [Steroidobacteraceae bacterium]